MQFCCIQFSIHLYLASAGICAFSELIAFLEAKVFEVSKTEKSHREPKLRSDDTCCLFGQKVSYNNAEVWRRIIVVKNSLIFSTNLMANASKRPNSILNSSVDSVEWVNDEPHHGNHRKPWVSRWIFMDLDEVFSVSAHFAGISFATSTRVQVFWYTFDIQNINEIVLHRSIRNVEILCYLSDDNMTFFKHCFFNMFDVIHFNSSELAIMRLCVFCSLVLHDQICYILLQNQFGNFPPLT